MKKLSLFIAFIILLTGCGSKPLNDPSEPLGEKVTVTVDENENSGTVSEETTNSQTGMNDTQAKLLKVTGDILNVRDMPAVAGSTAIGVVLEDSVFEILDEARDAEDQMWYKITFDVDKVGWIAGLYTEGFDNPNHFQLTSDQWKDYNTILKGMMDGGWYKEDLKKDTLNRNLVYDFDQDNKVDIVNFEFVIKDLDMGVEAIGQSTIRYKDQTLVFDYIDNGEYPWGLVELGVIDVNKDDNTLEFYIKEGDLADRVIYAFYRINNGSLEQITTMHGEILGVYGDGKIYFWGGHLIEPGYNSAHNPDMAVSYYDLYQKAYVTTEQIVGKSIELTWTTILFRTNEEVIDGAPLEFDTQLEMSKETRVALLEAGDIVTVLEIDTLNNRAKVASASGYEGWIGGFHMVWE